MPNPSVEMFVQIVSPRAGAVLSYSPDSDIEVTVTVDAWGVVRGGSSGGGGGGGGSGPPGGGSGPPGGGGGIPRENGGASGILGGSGAGILGAVEVEAGQVDVRLGQGAFGKATKVASPHLPRRWRFTGTVARTGPGPLVITVRAQVPQGFQGSTASESRTVKIVVDDPRHAAPEMVMELSLPRCLDEDDLETVAELVDEEAMPGVGAGRRVLAVCGSRPGLGSVVSIGVWFDGRGFSEATLNTALAQASIIRPMPGGFDLGLAISAHAIRSVVEDVWENTNKRAGRVTLDDDISVSIADGIIRTEVRGKYNPPLLPDISFKYTITEALSREPLNSDPPLAVDVSTDLDVSALVPVAVIVAMVSPALGGIVFFGGRYLSSRVARKRTEDLEGVGDTLAAEWPTHLLHPTDELPPEARELFPGKLVFKWRELTVDTGGVRTWGTHEGVEREPAVSIAGPTVVTGDVLPTTAAYSIETRDLRPNLQVIWSGATSGTGNEAIGSFPSAGRHSVNVTVTDEDGVTASASLEVDVSARPGPGDGQERL